MISKTLGKEPKKDEDCLDAVPFPSNGQVQGLEDPWLAQVRPGRLASLCLVWCWPRGTPCWDNPAARQCGIFHWFPTCFLQIPRQCIFVHADRSWFHVFRTCSFSFLVVVVVVAGSAVVGTCLAWVCILWKLGISSISFWSLSILPLLSWDAILLPRTYVKSMDLSILVCRVSCCDQTTHSMGKQVKRSTRAQCEYLWRTQNTKIYLFTPPAPRWATKLKFHLQALQKSF